MDAAASVTRAAMANLYTAGVNFIQLSLKSQQLISDRAADQKRETHFSKTPSPYYDSGATLNNAHPRPASAHRFDDVMVEGYFQLIPVQC